MIWRKTELISRLEELNELLGFGQNYSKKESHFMGEQTLTLMILVEKNYSPNRSISKSSCDWFLFIEKPLHSTLFPFSQKFTFHHGAISIVSVLLQWRE